jgi:hypothetical protein
VERADTISASRDSDRHMVRQVQLALARNRWFHFSQLVSRKLKVWRQARKLRRYNASLASADST